MSAQDQETGGEGRSNMDRLISAKNRSSVLQAQIDDATDREIASSLASVNARIGSMGKNEKTATSAMAQVLIGRIKSYRDQIAEARDRSMSAYYRYQDARIKFTIEAKRLDSNGNDRRWDKGTAFGRNKKDAQAVRNDLKEIHSNLMSLSSAMMAAVDDRAIADESASRLEVEIRSILADLSSKVAAVPVTQAARSFGEHGLTVRKKN